MKHSEDSMLPLQVGLTFPLALVGTMGKAEAELAAALIVLLCQKENAWRYVDPYEIGTAIRENVRLEAVRKSLWIVTPDYYELAKRGYGEFEGSPPEGKHGLPVRLTHLGKKAIFRGCYWPLPTPCPKCSTPSPCEEWSTRTTVHVAGGVVCGLALGDEGRGICVGEDVFVDETYACSIHGEFGLVGDKTPHFVDTEMWVRGPNGRRIRFGEAKESRR